MARTLGWLRTLICLAFGVAAIWFIVWKLQTAGDHGGLVYRDSSGHVVSHVDPPDPPTPLELWPAGRCDVDATEGPDQCVTWMAPDGDNWRAFYGPRHVRDALPIWNPLPSPPGD